MGSGSRLLAQITGPAKDKHGPQAPALADLTVRRTAGLRRQAKGLSHQTSPDQRSARPTGRPRRCAEQPRDRRVPPASEANTKPCPATDMDHKSDQANRAISTSQLNASPRLHIWPINVVVFHGSQGRTRFKGGFPLRCLQRLSRPYIATLHCGWRHNSSTRGTSIPVLSY